MGYKLPTGHPMAIRLNIEDNGWHTVEVSGGSSSSSGSAPVVGSFNDFTADEIKDDGM